MADKITDKFSKKLAKMTAQEFHKEEMYYSYSLKQYITSRNNALNYEDIYNIFVYYQKIENDEFDLLLHHLTRIGKNLELFRNVHNSFLSCEIKERIIKYFVPQEFEVIPTKLNEEDNAYKLAIINFIYEAKDCSEYYDVINRIKNKEYVFERVINSNSSIDKKKEDLYYLMIHCNYINDEAALLIAPYVLNTLNDSDSYKSFLNIVLNPSILKHHVLATKNKEIIAYYIVKARDYDLLKELFEDENKYLNYCTELWQGKMIMEDIKRFVREDCKYKYVDFNIQKYIDSSNEKLDIKIY